MVLQLSNHSKRFESENTPPTSKPSKTTHASSLRNSIQAASRRRRARTTGGAHSPRYAVEQAKRRSQTKSPPSSIRFDVTRTLRTPPPQADVEMKDAEQSKSTGLPTTSITLPRLLTRPDYREVPRENVTAVDAELAETPMDYIHDWLQELGPAMMQVLSGVRADPIKNALPKELSIVVNDLSCEMPTHMLAIYSRQAPASARRRVTLFPTHNIVLAAHCAHLPQLPTSPSPPAPSTPGEFITVPIVPLCIPSPDTFPQLSAYLYNKRSDHLLASLLPCPPPPSITDEGTRDAMLLQFAHKLAATYTTQALAQHAMTVNGLWRNVCALGVFDDDLWSTMDLAWEVVLTAIAIGTGNLRAMQA